MGQHRLAPECIEAFGLLGSPTRIVGRGRIRAPDPLEPGGDHEHGAEHDKRRYPVGGDVSAHDSLLTYGTQSPEAVAPTVPGNSVRVTMPDRRRSPSRRCGWCFDDMPYEQRRASTVA